MTMSQHIASLVTNNTITSGTVEVFNSAELSNNIIIGPEGLENTDQHSINKTIHDSKNDFKLGTVNFVPFLTALNSQAPSLNAPTPNPSISPSPLVPEYPAIAIVIVLMSVLIVPIAYERKTIN